MCKPTKESLFNFTKLDQVAQLYENLRIPRTSQMLAASQALGDMQLSRGQSSWIVSKMKELSIWINVQRYGTLPIMFQGAGYNYSQEVMKALEPKAKL